MKLNHSHNKKILVILLMFFGGCVRQKTKVDSDEIHKVCQQSALACEARLIDVPFPFDVYPVDLAIDQVENVDLAQSALSYEATLSKEQLGEFYHNEMERLGWKELFFVKTADEWVVIFEKPLKLFVLSIKHTNDNHKFSLVRCFISLKTAF